MSDLNRKRILFTKHFGQLPQIAAGYGYDARYEQVLRTLQEAQANAASGAGIAHSLHLLGLAGDVSLFDSTGRYMDGSTPGDVAAYAKIGAWWKSLSDGTDTFCWGGDFAKRDLDHYSIEWNGVR